ncbi:MAG: hypothetical protein U9Q71_02375, partial [Pseudomonadota bacterium]|nr:hypothetical protein [Pseudomonadota bacterium]
MRETRQENFLQQIASARCCPIAAGLFLFAGSTVAFAEETAGGQSLKSAANDPTASLMSVQLQDVYAGDYHNLEDEQGNVILLRSAMPFKTGRFNHIARGTLPIVTNSPTRESGIGDLVLFDLMAFDKPWGRWGAGLVLLAPTASDESLGAEKWAIGPALGFVRQRPGLLSGLFLQNLFSFAGEDDRDDVNVSILQPIV